MRINPVNIEEFFGIAPDAVEPIDPVEPVEPTRRAKETYTEQQIIETLCGFLKASTVDQFEDEINWITMILRIDLGF